MSLIALAPRGWAEAHPPVLLLGAREVEDGRIEADAVLITHALKAKTLFGTWYLPNGKTRRVRVRWTPNTEFGMSEETSTLEQT